MSPTDPGSHGVVAPLDMRGAPDAETLLSTLHELRRRRDDPDFWTRFCATVGALCRARGALVIVAGAEGASWTELAADLPPDGVLAAARDALLDELAARALGRGFAQASRDGALVVAVSVLGTEAPTLLLLEIPARERAQLNELVLRARLVADLPPVGGAAAAGAPDGLIDVLDLLINVMREQRFGAASLALVNGLAAHLGITQVALGWSEGGYVRAQAISHLDRFERKTENVQLLEAAFEEALDQEADLHWPAGEDDGVVVVAHGRFLRALGYREGASLVLRHGDAEPEAVVLLATEHGPLPAEALPDVRFALHLLLPWLDNLRGRDRWAGARLAAWARDGLGRLVGPEHVGRKAVGAVVAGALLYVLLGTWSHEIEASAELRTDSTRVVSAPYEGFFDEVHVTAGDAIDAGAVLGTLDVQDLHLQESESLADIRRYRAEADRARAAGEMAEMEISSARQEQAVARLERVRYLLEQASLEAPFDGIVVEGERSDLLGRPVRQGDPLFRIARIEGLYAVLQVPERDIRWLEDAEGGSLRLLSQPGVEIPFHIETLIPVARVRGQEGNHFLVKVRLTVEPEEWWRPGMAGMARIDAGRANIAWLLTHRLIDQLRITFWW